MAKKSKQLPAAEAGEQSPGFLVASPLTHDGEAYGVGETVEMSEDQAAPLLALKVLERPAAAKAPEPAPQGTAQGAGTGDTGPDGDPQ